MAKQIDEIINLSGDSETNSDISMEDESGIQNMDSSDSESSNNSSDSSGSSDSSASTKCNSGSSVTEKNQPILKSSNNNEKTLNVKRKLNFDDSRKKKYHYIECAFKSWHKWRIVLNRE